MKKVFLLLTVFMLCGCSLVLKEDDRIRTYGIKESEVTDLLGKIGYEKQKDQAAAQEEQIIEPQQSKPRIIK